MLSTFFGYTVFTLACAVAPTWAGLLIFRFLAGAFASAPITVVGGIFADIYDDPVRRGQAIALIGVRIKSVSDEKSDQVLTKCS